MPLFGVVASPGQVPNQAPPEYQFSMPSNNVNWNSATVSQTASECTSSDIFGLDVFQSGLKHISSKACIQFLVPS